MADETLQSPQEYLATVPPAGQAWLQEFWDYMATTYPQVEPTMFRQRPMYKLGRTYHDGYVMFTATATGFTTHAIDFDLVEQTRAAIPGAKGGKGSVAVRYADEQAKPALRAFVDAVMARHLSSGS